MKAPDKIFCNDKDGNILGIWFNEPAGSTDVAYIRKDALLKILTDLRDDAGVRDDQYEKDAILEYNLYDELINTVNEM